MLTENEVLAELSHLRERSAVIDYTGEIPRTRRSAAATVAPVAALAALGTLGAGAVIGHGSGVDRSRADQGGASSATETLAPPGARGAGLGDTVELVSAHITLGGKTIAYSHAVGADPFPHGWQLAVDLGASLPQGATRFVLPDGAAVWVADASSPGTGNSLLIVAAGPRNDYYGAPSTFSRDELEDFVRTGLSGR